ncbi:MAG: EAL domain-containing protein [Ruminococcus sp.]|nr:EAL domain-containing protein [Ruminococcus sp.]
MSTTLTADDKRRKKILKKRIKKIRKIRKNHIFGMLLIVLLITALILFGTLVFSLNYTLSSTNQQMYKDSDMMVHIAELYDDPRSGSDEKSLFYIMDSESQDYFILDKEGNVLFEEGENTCLMNEGSPISEITDEDNGTEDGKLSYNDITTYSDKTETNRSSENNYAFLGGRVTRLMANYIVSTFKTSSLEQILNTINSRKSYSQTAISIPYWLSIPVKNGEAELYVKWELNISVYQMTLTFMMISSFLAIMAILLIIILIVLISSMISKKRLANLCFTDIVTKGNNQQWLEYAGGEYLCSRKLSRSRCAVIDVNFANYHSLAVSHSAQECEEMLRQIYRRIYGYFGKKKNCVHCAASDFAVITKAENDEELRTSLNGLIKTLEGITKEHSYKFHIGVAPVEKALNRSGRPAHRRFADIMEYWSSAGTARATLEDEPDSGIAFYDDKLVEEQKWINTVTEMQKQALKDEEFLVYYQPKYDPKTNTLRGAEALIRWQSPKYGFVTPNRMIPIFEKNGFITEIDHYMITHVARDQKRWLDEGMECVPVSVNVSRAHFAEPDLAEQIRDSVDKEGAPHNLIEIELTESAFFDDKNAMISTIERLKSYGFAVSMDDFGSGYSSLNSLKDMPLDVLKLDAEFFRGEGTNCVRASGERGEIVVSEAIRLAKSLKMRTVAEGVEIKEQVDFLAEQGCDMIQGYFYSKPVPSAEFLEKMKNPVSGGDDRSAEKALPEQNTPKIDLTKGDVPVAEPKSADRDNRL